MKTFHLYLGKLPYNKDDLILLIVKCDTQEQARVIAKTAHADYSINSLYCVEEPGAERRSALEQAIELQVAHQIERRRLWAAAYIKASLTGNEPSFVAHSALKEFDKTFPTIHAQ